MTGLGGGDDLQKNCTRIYAFTSSVIVKETKKKQGASSNNGVSLPTEKLLGRASVHE